MNARRWWRRAVTGRCGCSAVALHLLRCHLLLDWVAENTPHTTGELEATDPLCEAVWMVDDASDDLLKGCATRRAGRATWALVSGAVVVGVATATWWAYLPAALVAELVIAACACGCQAVVLMPWAAQQVLAVARARRAAADLTDRLTGAAAAIDPGWRYRPAGIRTVAADVLAEADIQRRRALVALDAPAGGPVCGSHLAADCLRAVLDTELPRRLHAVAAALTVPEPACVAGQAAAR